MKFEINYKSIIAIGGFNPTILTPDFLSEYCSFKSDHTPSGQTTFVATEVIYGNIKFQMELNRFQILLENIQDFKEKYPIEIMLAYLNVLKYTPLSLIGINFNYSLSDINKDATIELLKDPYKTGECFNIIPTSISLTLKRPNGGGLTLSETKFMHFLDNNIKNNIRIIFDQNMLKINNNYEVGDLGKERDRVNILFSNYNDLFERNQQLINIIGNL